MTGDHLKGSVPRSVGRVVRRLRIAAEMTQEALGLEAGLQRNYVSSLELGEKQPSLTSIFKLAKALKIAPSLLIEFVEVEQGSSDVTADAPGGSS